MKNFKLSLICILTAVLLAVVMPSVQRTDTGPPGKVETVMQKEKNVMIASQASHFTCHQVAYDVQSSAYTDRLNDPGFTFIESKRVTPVKFSLTDQRSRYLYRWPIKLKDNNRNEKPPLLLRT